MISVVIPALNEADTIGDMVRFALADPGVTEVIVVDDGSIDGTPDWAAAAGARVITSMLLGKGVSMQEGMWLAQNDVVLYLDGDLKGLSPTLVADMTGPLLRDEADFVKARFTRSGGRVTLLTARPLLGTLFPEVRHFEQPLAGIVAARKSLLERLQFENDYGVDVGLLIDAAVCGARLAEVDVGFIEHESQPLHALGKMAAQVARTILARAGQYGRLRSAQLRTARDWELHHEASRVSSLEDLPSCDRLALLDMDGTLVDARFAEELALVTRRRTALTRLLDNPDLESAERTRQIAALFTGTRREVFEQVARRIPLMAGAVNVVVGLRKAGFRVGIVTDSFLVASEVVRRRVFADFSIGHVLTFHDGRATGEVLLAPAMIHPAGCPEHAYCKANVLRHLMEKGGLQAEQVLAVGDGENDVCLLRAAGRSIAFRPRSSAVRHAAGCVVEEDLSEVLDMVSRHEGVSSGACRDTSCPVLWTLGEMTG